MNAASLDIDAVRTFILVAELSSFTKAAEQLGISQAAVSIKLKRLEEQLGRRLLERTPRRVRLSPQGLAFIDAARALLGAHENALRATAPVDIPASRVGISNHVVGHHLPELLAALSGDAREKNFEVRLANSSELRSSLKAGLLDYAVVRSEVGDARGEVLWEDPLGWFASQEWLDRSVGSLDLVTVSEPCALREIAVRVLSAEGLPWREAFVGSDTMTSGIAAAKGIGVAVLAKRMATPEHVDVQAALGLPPLPPSQVLLLAGPGACRRRDRAKMLAENLQLHLLGTSAVVA